MLAGTMMEWDIEMVRVGGFKPPGTRFVPRLNRPRRYQLRFTPEFRIIEIRWDVLESNQPSHPLS